MTRDAVLTDAQWSVIERLLPCSDGVRGRPFRDHRQVIERIIYRYRCGIAWRDLPGDCGPWQTVWKRHRRFAGDGTWDAVLAVLLSTADAEGALDWSAVAVDSSICRVHSMGATLAQRGSTCDLAGLPIRPDIAGVGAARVDGPIGLDSQKFARSGPGPIVMPT